MTYAHNEYLDANRTVMFRWSIGNSRDYAPDTSKNTSDVLVGELTAPTHGYIAWGISPNGGLPGANMLVMWVDSATGVVHVQDRYATAFIEPLVVEDSKAVLSYSGYENATHTVIEFVRWLGAGCDNVHDVSIAVSIYILFSHSSHIFVSYYKEKRKKNLTTKNLSKIHFELHAVKEVRQLNFMFINLVKRPSHYLLFWRPRSRRRRAYSVSRH